MPTDAAWRKARRDSGMCASCFHRPKTRGYTQCAPCRAKANAYSREYQKGKLAKGLCFLCGKPRRGDYQRCESCRKKQKDARTALIAKDGQCVMAARCTEPRLPGTQKCFYHWMVQACRTHNLKTKDAGMLKRIWDKQGGLCALTGEKMTPGGGWPHGASIDHIVPTSKGGLTEENNIRWTTVISNWMKTDMTDEQLLAECVKVVNHLSPKK